jgi:hypothetical protein
MILNVKIHIIMGCYGLKDDDFVCCPGIDNKIYSFDKKSYFYKEIMDYLDNCKLFEKPIYDYNATRNFLSRFKQKFENPISPIWVERKYNIYQKFAIDHKNCGLFLKLSTEKIETSDSKLESENRSNILKLIQK